MRIGFLCGMQALFVAMPAIAQEPDSVSTVSLNEVVISESYRNAKNRSEAQHFDVIGKEALQRHLSGSLMQSLEQVPGVQSMDIGSGFSKPMIRGMGFSRVLVAEHGVKQEGQQWGADHGLEVDALNIEQVSIRKGPASLLYGSDAMGGVVEIRDLNAPFENQVFGEALFVAKSVNGSLGASLMAGVKKGAWYTRMRFTEHHYGDYRIPTDTIVYLTQRLPVHNGRLKNTAGYERDLNWTTGYTQGAYRGKLHVSNVFQKSGFFPGAHGIPDADRVADDGNSRNIEYPLSTVNHFKIVSNQQYQAGPLALAWDASWQNNHREEWSLFHTHYATQPAPATDPDKELEFRLNTLGSTLKGKFNTGDRWEHQLGTDMQYQQNRIGGYSFLLPEYNRLSAAGFWVGTFRITSRLTLSGGVRYDWGQLDLQPYHDAYLALYLRQQGYPEAQAEANAMRSYAVKRDFNDLSGSVGMVWDAGDGHLLKANLGRSFRLPGANELTSNGVHHGTFRHEQGDASLQSETGWQLDAAYTYTTKLVEVTVSPFASWFTNYIYLRPTGEWSILPHAGQIYKYTGVEALFAGAELSLNVRLPAGLHYEGNAEYVYTRNLEEAIPLTFSPPATMRHTLSYRNKGFDAYVQYQAIAPQNRVARNEDTTPGAHLLHAGLSYRFKVGNLSPELVAGGRNLFNTRYYNHLSFYRKIEVPEPGRSFQLMVKIPFKQIIK